MIFAQLWNLNFNSEIRRGIKVKINYVLGKMYLYSVETTYEINSVISKLIPFVENAKTGQFLFLIMLISSYFTCSWRHPFLSYDVTPFFF
jgi:hypothetical protein